MNVSCMNAYPCVYACYVALTYPWSHCPVCVCVCVRVVATHQGQSTSTYQRHPLRLTVQTAWSQTPAPKTRAPQRKRARAQTMTTRVTTPTEEAGNRTERGRNTDVKPASRLAGGMPRWRPWIRLFGRAKARWRRCCCCCDENKPIVQECEEKFETFRRDMSNASVEERGFETGSKVPLLHFWGRPERWGKTCWMKQQCLWNERLCGLIPEGVNCYSITVVWFRHGSC